VETPKIGREEKRGFANGNSESLGGRGGNGPHRPGTSRRASDMKNPPAGSPYPKRGRFQRRGNVGEKKVKTRWKLTPCQRGQKSPPCKIGPFVIKRKGPDLGRWTGPLCGAGQVLRRTQTDTQSFVFCPPLKREMVKKKKRVSEAVNVPGQAAKKKVPRSSGQSTEGD